MQSWMSTLKRFTVVHYGAAMKSVLIAIIAALTASTAAASDGSIKDTLKKQYQNHVLFFRFAYQSGDQEFDSTGKPLKDALSNGWIVYGPVWVNKLDLDTRKLILRGPRVAFANSKKLNARISVPLEKKEVKFVIHLDHPLTSANEGEALLGKVFSTGKSAEHPLPEYRRASGDIGPGETLYHFSSNKADGKDQLSMPVPVYTPDPDYSDQARKAKYQGTVKMNVIADKQGTVSRVEITDALGLGLDEKSVEKVRVWRFKPGLRNGEPVFVEMSVEVEFHLF